MKQRVFRQLYPIDESRLSPLNSLIILVIVSSVFVAVLGTEKTLMERYVEIFVVLDLIFGIAFVIEYALRIWVIGEFPRFSGIAGRYRYVVTPIALVDLIVILPFVLQWTSIEELYALRLLRVLRILALAKLGHFSKAVYRVGSALHAKRFELYASIAMAGLLLLVSASLMYLIEGAAQPETFGSIPRSLWWAIATLTTVGYGDVYPVTPVGKLLAGMTALSAIGLIALPAGILASAFSDAFTKK